MPATMETVRDLTGVIASYLGNAANAVVAEEAERIAEDMRQRILGGPKSGHLYTSGPEPLPHQASAPGESPANWTGALVESIQTEIVAPGEAEIKVDATYAAILEHGSDGGKIAPRPFMQPALEQAAPEFIAALAERFEAAVRL